jgi:nucleotide-binding universal stress UspA family protein
MIAIKHILCPVDFSDCSRQAVRYAAAIARSYGSSITLLNVQSSAALAFAGPEMLLPVLVLTPELRARLEADLTQLVQHETAGARVSDCEVREGAPTDEILARAEITRADLIVLGTHGRKGFERLVLGSVAEKVLRKARCPVLTVPLALHDVAPAPPVFKRILCPIDFSLPSMRALDFAVSLTQGTPARLTVTHVFELEGSLAEDLRVRLSPRSVREHLQALEAERRDRLARAIPEPARAGKLEPCMVSGVPYRQILRLAAEQSSDLIVMGVHGRSAADMFFLGSTTNQVVRHATCPVLTVRST